MGGEWAKKDAWRAHTPPENVNVEIWQQDSSNSAHGRMSALVRETLDCYYLVRLEKKREGIASFHFVDLKGFQDFGGGGGWRRQLASRHCYFLHCLNQHTLWLCRR